MVNRKIFPQKWYNLNALQKTYEIDERLGNLNEPERKDSFFRRLSKRFSRRDAFKSDTHLDHWEIKQKAIQILHTDLAEKQSAEQRRDAAKWVFFQKALHPNGKFRRCFDLITVIWVIWLTITIPFEIGFSWYTTSKNFKFFSGLLDCWFALDIILNFRTGYIKKGTVIMNESKIVRHYLSTWFVIDALGTFPFERLLDNQSSSRKSLKLVKYFKIPKLMRISRVLRFFHDKKQVYDIFEYLVFVMSFFHFGACIWMRVLDPCPDVELAYNEDHICSQDQIANAYIQALHISTVTTLGISSGRMISNEANIDIMDEAMNSVDSRSTVFVTSTVFMLFGLIQASVLFSKMNVYVMGKMQGSAAFQRRNDRVNHEMEYYSVPDELQKQVKAYYNYVWVHQKQYDDKIALLNDTQMSSDLQRKLALHLFRETVSHISLFAEVDELMLGEICLSLRTKVFLPKDMIIFKDDVGRELFIISKGVVEVMRDDLPKSKRYLSPPILLRKGSFFGEIALIMESRRTCSVQARTICELNVLHQDTFDRILRKHPSFARKMNELVVARQLESCLERAKVKGVKVVFTRNDMEKAIGLVEQNMYDCLKRRSNTDTNFRTNISDNCQNFGGKTESHGKGETCNESNDETQYKTIENKADVNNSPKLTNEQFGKISHSVYADEITDNMSCNKTNKHLHEDVVDTKLSNNSSSKLAQREKLHESTLKLKQRQLYSESSSDIEEGEDTGNNPVGHFTPGQEIPLNRVRRSIIDPPVTNDSSNLQKEIIRTLLPNDKASWNVLLNAGENDEIGYHGKIS